MMCRINVFVFEVAQEGCLNRAMHRFEGHLALWITRGGLLSVDIGERLVHSPPNPFPLSRPCFPIR